MAFDRGHAIVVGVGTYQAAQWNVPVTAGDATGVANALTDQSVAAYPSNQVALLHDQGATLKDLIGALDDLSGRVTPDDTAVIFFAGHGVLGDDEQYYLTTHDTQFSPGGMARQGTGLSESVLLEKLRSIDAQKVLLIINACFSGHVQASLGDLEAGEVRSLGSPPSPNLNVRVLASGEGRAVITASRATQKSFYDRNDHSATFFGRALIDGLRGRAGNGHSGYIGLFELYEFVYTTVKQEAAKIRSVQEPVLNLAAGVGPFPVAMEAGGSVEALGGRPRIQQDLPSGTAAEVIDRQVIEASRGFQPGMRVEGTAFAVGRDINVKVVDFGNARIGRANLGDVAAGDIVKITISTTPTQAAEARDIDDLPRLIASVRQDVERLTGAGEDDLGDIDDELKKASRAVVQSNPQRVLEKLDAARKLLLALGPAVPAAVPLSETVGVLLQRTRTVTQ